MFNALKLVGSDKQAKLGAQAFSKKVKDSHQCMHSNSKTGRGGRVKKMRLPLNLSLSARLQPSTHLPYTHISAIHKYTHTHNYVQHTHTHTNNARDTHHE